MLVDKQNELMSNLLVTVHQHGGDDVTWKPPKKQEAEQDCRISWLYCESEIQFFREHSKPAINERSLPSP